MTVPDRRRLLAPGVWLLGALIFFRTPIFSGFGTITGDEGDIRLVSFLHEHWWKVVQGDAPWRDPPAFFPAHDVLSYSDTFVLDTILYVPLRAIGVESLVAVQLCLIALTAVGFASVYLLLRRHLALGRAVASTLAACVAFANNLYIDTPHAQLFSVAVVPLIVLLGVEAWRAESIVAARWWAAAAGAALGLLLWSSFYFGWFAVVAGGVAAIVGVGLAIATRQLGALVAALRTRRQAMLAAALGLAVMMVPFFVTYWPALQDGRDRSYDEVAGLAPRPFDMINAGGDNVVWGRLLAAITSDDARLQQLNRATALTPILLIATLVAGSMLLLDLRRREPWVRSRLGVVAALTAMVLVALPVQFGFGGAWSWLHRFVPGGAAIRVYARVEVVNVFVAVMAVACWLAAPTTRPRRAWMALAVPLLIAVEQLNTTDDFRRLDRDAQVTLLASVPSPPSVCEAFWVLPPAGRNADHASIDAMLISHRVDLPTVNGYSGWQPDGWHLQPGSPTYEADVAAWLDANALTESTCAYETATATWHAPRPAIDP